MKGLVVALLVCLMGISGYSIALADDLDFINGFRDIKWGEKAESIKNLKEAGKDVGFTWYTLEETGLKLNGRIEVATVMCGFYKNQFGHLIIITKSLDIDSATFLKESLFKKLGQGEKGYEDNWDWFIGSRENQGIQQAVDNEIPEEMLRMAKARVWVDLKVTEIEGNAQLSVQNMEIQNQRLEEQRGKIREDGKGL